MESQDAVTEQKPFILDELEDIPNIDDDDTSSSTGENVTVISRGPLSDVIAGRSSKAKGDDSQEIIKERDESLPEEIEVVNIVVDNVDKGDKGDYDQDKIEDDEEASCTDDTPLNSQTEGGLSGAMDPPSEECVTHSLSFAINSKGVRKESVPCSETESHADDSRISDAHATLSSQESPSNKAKTKVKKSKKLSPKDGRDSDSSMASSKKKKSTKTSIKSKFAPGSFEYIQERLSGRLFSGWVEERKWVESLAGYRDVVEVDEWEEEMNHVLFAIIRSIPGVQEGSKWINITPPAINCPCYCVWSLLSTPPAPGHYWFSVTGVALHPLFGLRVMLKMIRSIHPHDGELAAARRKKRKELALRGPGHELQSLSEQVQEWLQQVNLSVIWSAISLTFTLSNIKETFRFVIVLCMTLVVGLVALVRESHHFILQFIHTAGVFFHNITPFLQSLLAFVEKIIGGMYLLIAMVYKDFRRPSPPPQPPFAITNSPGFSPSYMPPTGPRTIKYVPPEQWVYTSQNTNLSDS